MRDAKNVCILDAAVSIPSNKLEEQSKGNNLGTQQLVETLVCSSGTAPALEAGIC